MTSIERTAYPRFKRLITARELHLFFSPGQEESEWAARQTNSGEHQLALLLMLNSYQRMGRFPKQEEIPDIVVDFVRRAAGLPEGTLLVYASKRTAEQHRTWVRRRAGVRYDGKQARELARETIRVEAESKNNPADLINVALEKLVEAGLEGPELLPSRQAGRVRAHRRAVRRAGPERHRLRPDRGPLQGPHAGRHLGARGPAVLLPAAAAPALGVQAQRPLHRVPRGRAGGAYGAAAEVPHRPGDAPPGDSGHQQGRGVQRVLRMGALRRGDSRQRPHRAGEGAEVQLAAGQRHHLPQHAGHRRRGAPAAGRGRGRRARGPGPDLPLPDRAHHEIRRVLDA